MAHIIWWPLLRLQSWYPVKSLQLIWRSRTHRCHLYGCLIFKWAAVTWLKDWYFHPISNSSNGHQGDMPYFPQGLPGSHPVPWTPVPLAVPSFSSSSSSFCRPPLVESPPNWSVDGHLPHPSSTSAAEPVPQKFQVTPVKIFIGIHSHCIMSICLHQESCKTTCLMGPRFFIHKSFYCKWR